MKRSTAKPTTIAKLAATCAALALAAPAAATGWGVREASFQEVIQKVVSMPSDGDLQSRTSRHGLNVINVMWEDTGRAGGSSVGPNISDLTLQVREEVNGGTRTHLLPVIRYPNFTDKTGDIPADKLWVRVGNQHSDGDTVAVPLAEVLGNLKEYLSDPSSLKGDGDLTARRDSHYLVSAQHVFLPISRSGKVEFNPVIFNYQSAPGSPAVLTLLVTREGTSATIVDNRGGDQSLQGWGQQLFFNNAGQKTVFTAERRSAVERRIERQGAILPGDKGALEEGADMMMVIQVPLKHADRGYMMGFGGMADESEAAPMPAQAPATKSARARSDVERAVLGHGEDLGPFHEMGGLELERDDRFPVRVTVQFYKATSNGVVSDADLAEVAASIDKVYASADYVGSLVVPEGQRHRPTDWIKDQPDHHAWQPFDNVRRFVSWIW